MRGRLPALRHGDLNQSSRRCLVMQKYSRSGFHLIVKVVRVWYFLFIWAGPSGVIAAGQSHVGKCVIDRRAANQRPRVGAACLDGMKTSLGQKTKSANLQICNNNFGQQSCVFIAYVEISKRIARRVEACAQHRKAAMKMWQKRVACLCWSTFTA